MLPTLYDVTTSLYDVTATVGQQIVAVGQQLVEWIAYPLSSPLQERIQTIWQRAGYRNEAEFKKLRKAIVDKMHRKGLKEEQGTLLHFMDEGMLSAIHVRVMAELEVTEQTPKARWCFTAQGVRAIASDVFTPFAIATMTDDGIARSLSISGLALLQTKLFTAEELLKIDWDIACTLLYPPTDPLGAQLFILKILTKDNVFTSENNPKEGMFKIEYVQKRVKLCRQYPNALQLIRYGKVDMDKLLEMEEKVLASLCSDETLKDINTRISQGEYINIYCSPTAFTIKPNKAAEESSDS